MWQKPTVQLRLCVAISLPITGSVQHEEDREKYDEGGNHGIYVSEQERNHKEEHDHLHHPGFGGSTEFIGDEVDFERGRLHDRQEESFHGGSRAMDHQNFQRHDHQDEHAGEHGMMGYHDHDTMRGNYHVGDQNQHLGIQFVSICQIFNLFEKKEI